MNLNEMALLIGKREKQTPVFDDYIDHVANQSLLPYKTVLQHGGKKGQSLYMHVLDGVLVLESLREPLGLSDNEARTLYTAFTIHDLNKAPGQPPEKSFSKLATQENIAAEIERLNIATFFPEWREYLADIESLVRGHSGHYHTGGEMLIPKRGPAYKLGMERVAALVKLMQAADIIDLSHTLAEQEHKNKFLSHLNAYLAESGQPRQYEFVTHQLSEQRGLLTNVIHNSITAYMSETHNLIPLLYYPDGVAYLMERGQVFAIQDEEITVMAERIAETISGVTSSKFKEFINSTGQGIKVDAKCLELGIPFKKILDEIYNLVQRRSFDPADLDAKARDWAQREFEKSQQEYPQAAEAVQAALDSPDLLVSSNPDRLRLAELVRSYYVFLNKHFSKTIPDAWAHIYALLDLAPERHAYYAYFNALWVRAYVIAADLDLDLSQRDEGHVPPELIARLSRAVDRQQVVEFEYDSTECEPGFLERHRVKIYELPYFDTERGHYYLRAWCEHLDYQGRRDHVHSYRYYRLDRMKTVEVLPTRFFEPPPTGDEFEVKYRLSQAIARHEVNYNSAITIESVETEASGAKIVRGTTHSLFWATRFLLHYGEACTVLGGPELRREMDTNCEGNGSKLRFWGVTYRLG